MNRFDSLLRVRQVFALAFTDSYLPPDDGADSRPGAAGLYAALSSHLLERFSFFDPLLAANHQRMLGVGLACDQLFWIEVLPLLAFLNCGTRQPFLPFMFAPRLEPALGTEAGKLRSCEELVAERVCRKSAALHPLL